MSAGIFAANASHYWALGLSPLPLETGSKRPAREITGWPGFVNGPPSLAKKEEWLQAYPERGLGILLGTVIGGDRRLGAVDVDQDCFMAVTEAILGPGSPCKIGRRGCTYFVSYADMKSTSLKDYDGLGAADILLSGKFSTLPPSIHPDTGQPYRWKGQSLLDVDFASLPVLTRERLDLLRLVVGSEHAKVVVSGKTTHDAGVALTAQLMHFGCVDEEVSGIFRALLPAGYAGNSIEELPGWIDSARKKGFGDQAGAGSGRGKKIGIADLLVHVMEEMGVVLFRDAEKRPFMSVPGQGTGTLTYLLGSMDADEVLGGLAYHHLGVGLKESQLTDVNLALRTRAKHRGNQIQIVFNRVARVAGTIFIDLGTPDGSVVEITGEGFRILGESPVRFIRATGMAELPRPVKGGSLDKLRRMLSLTDDTFVLFVAFVLNCLRSPGPYMCLTIEGEQGSGKSFLSNVVRLIVDPNAAGSVRLPNNERDIMVLAADAFLLSFDNTSGMRAEISDVLCSIATGAGYISRLLYSNGALHLMRATRPTIINGISDFATRPDLLERAIPLILERPDDGERKTEEEMLTALHEMMPEVLGAFYDMVSCALQREKEVEVPRSFRMADVARWLSAAEPATGFPVGTFVEALERSQGERIIERTNNDPLVVALREHLADGPLDCTFGELLTAIMPTFNRPRNFPDNALQLSKALSRLRTGMKLAGIFFERGGRGNSGQRIRVWLEGQEHDPPQKLDPSKGRLSY